MSIPPVLNPMLQFVDADGEPYAGGTLATLVVGTSTPKDTWVDHLQASLNPNPIVLDSAGRALAYGDGDYRLVLRDGSGNLVFDQWSTTLISAAMMPVVSAPDLPTARQAMGITDAIAAETTRAENAEAALQTALNAEVSRAESAEAALQTALNNEIARAEAAEAALQAAINAMGGQFVQSGEANTDSTGRAHVDFPTPYTSLGAVTATIQLSSGYTGQVATIGLNPTSSGFDAFAFIGSHIGVPATFGWIAVGTK